MNRASAFPLWCAGLATALLILHSIGGDLAAPPSPHRWRSWIDAIGPATAVVASLRVIALTAGWYLVVLTVAGALAHRLRLGGLARSVDRLAPAFLIRLVSVGRAVTVSALGLTMVVVPIVPTVRTAHEADVASQSQSAASLVVSTAPSTATLQRQAPAPAPPEQAAPEFGYVRVPRPVPRSPLEAAPRTWVVSTGDHFWSIAEETLTDGLGGPPRESQTATYWLELIEINRDRLVSPANPDLIYPGQEFLLPPFD